MTTSFAKPKDREGSPDPQASLELSPTSFSPKAEIADELLVIEGKDPEKKIKSTSRKHKNESEELRKHRKHKKRKKHKKHRKNIYEVVSTTQEEPVLGSSSILDDQSEHSQESLAPPNSETSTPSPPSDEIEAVPEPTNSNAAVTLNEEDDEVASRDNDNSSNYSIVDKVSVF